MLSRPGRGGSSSRCGRRTPAARGPDRRGDHPLERDGELWSGAVAAQPGDDYLLVLDGEALADPYSRFQPEGLDGPSRIVDTAALRVAPRRSTSTTS